MNPLFSCDHMHEVGRDTDSDKEWNYAYRTGIGLPVVVIKPLNIDNANLEAIFNATNSDNGTIAI